MTNTNNIRYFALVSNQGTILAHTAISEDQLPDSHMTKAIYDVESRRGQWNGGEFVEVTENMEAV